MRSETKSPSIGFRATALACLVFWALSAAVLTHAYLSFTNRLYGNTNWISTKTTLEKGVMGAYEFIRSPQALAHNRLNLGAWHGFQEILYKDAVEPGSIEFDVMLSSGSYIIALFNKHKAGFSGIRVGGAPYQSMFFTADAAGGFTSRSVLQDAAVRPGSWNRGRLEFGDGAVSLYLNGMPCGTFRTDSAGPGQVGFRGCAGTVLLDNVVIRGKDSRELAREDFSNKRHRAPVFLLALAALGVVNIAVYLVLSFAGSSAETIKAGTMGTGFLLLLASLMLFAFWQYRSERYRGTGPQLPEEARYWNNSGLEHIVENIRSRYSRPPGKGVHRVLFVGSSQTWGAGAAADNETMVSFAEREMNARSSTNYECINAAISGIRSDTLFRLYADEWIGLGHETVVVNLGYNDRNFNDRFSKGLSRFAAVNRERGIRTIFVYEAVAHRIDREPMSAVVRHWNVPVIDLDGYIRENEDSGLIWWDEIHLAPCGQRLAGAYLAQEIAKYLR